MKKPLSILAILVATTTAAAADPTDATKPTSGPGRAVPPAGYLGLGGTLGLSNIGYAGFALDGGVKLGSTPLYVRGQVERGVGSTVFADGTYQAYRLGIEARYCDRAFRGCLFGGVDGGLRRSQLIDDKVMTEENASDPIVVPRAGAELGSRIKARIALELPTSIRDDETLMGFGATAGIGYAF